MNITARDDKGLCSVSVHKTLSLEPSSPQQVTTRSSAQGNCSAKSLAGNVIDSSLSSTSHAVHGGGSRGRGSGGGGSRQGGGGGGQGTFHPPCHILHYHMVLRPKGTSHHYQLTCPLRLSFLSSPFMCAHKSKRRPHLPACPSGCAVCDYDSTATGNTKCLRGGCEPKFYQNTDLSCTSEWTTWVQGLWLVHAERVM